MFSLLSSAVFSGCLDVNVDIWKLFLFNRMQLITSGFFNISVKTNSAVIRVIKHQMFCSFILNKAHY